MGTATPFHAGRRSRPIEYDAKIRIPAAPIFLLSSWCRGLAWGVAEAPSVYRPRHPERTTFYRIFERGFDRYLDVYEERYEPRCGFLRGVVRPTVEAFLDCGRLMNGVRPDPLPLVQRGASAGVQLPDAQLLSQLPPVARRRGRRCSPRGWWRRSWPP